MKGRWIEWTADQLAWIEARREMPRRELHTAFVATFGRDDVSQSNITALCKRRGWFTGRNGRLEKCNVPHNKGVKGWTAPGSEKGWFRKGGRRGVATRLYKPIGTERLSKDGYVQRKVNDDLPLQRRWRGVHLINWEAQHGPVPEGHALKCLDGNRLNTDAANWHPVPRSSLPRLAAGKRGIPYDTAPAELKPTLLAIAELEHAARQAKKASAT